MMLHAANWIIFNIVLIIFALGFQLISRVLNTSQIDEEHTAANLATHLKSVLNQWKISDNKVIAVVTDNKVNILKAIKDFTPFHHISCFAHTLNLVIKTPLKLMITFLVCWKNVVISSHTLKKVQQQRLNWINSAARRKKTETWCKDSLEFHSHYVAQPPRP